jgi:Tfp pilus assembly protein PilX
MRSSLEGRLTRLGSQDGFTMIIALGVLLVTSLLLLAAFAAANGDIGLSHGDSTQKQAYAAALAGVQEYEYQLQNNPNYWESCPEPSSSTTLKEAGASYQVKPLTANKASACSSSNPFETMIESTGVEANTFRVESVGKAGNSTRKIVATFAVNGFLNYVYFTRFEDQDPQISGQSKASCERYYEEKGKSKRSSSCVTIQFTKEDSVAGPFNTNDSADVCGEVEFGRAGHSPLDTVEINGGTYASECENGISKPKYNTTSKTFSKGEELIPPASDTSLAAYVESGYSFEGATTLTLEGSNVTVKNANYNAGVAKSIPLPSNGLIYVHGEEGSGAEACEYTYKQTTNVDTAAAIKEELPCGTAYVKGTYSKSLTIGTTKDIVVKGNILPTGVSTPATGSAPSTPSGTVTLGLIATEFVRIFHACSGNSEEGLKNPWIFAAILSTSHSFTVDNDNCGKPLGELNTFGAIGQNYRGVVGQGSDGYIKNYNYDPRLATDEPPYFLAPLKAGWKVARETSPTGG